MEHATKALQKGVSSKEFKELVKCASDHCKDYEHMLHDEENLVKELVKLQDNITKPNKKSVSSFMESVKEILHKTLQLIELNKNKKATMCVIKKCGKEYVDVIANKSMHMGKFYKDQEQTIDKAIKKLKKQQKHK